MRIAAIILAREGSKRIPNKNMKDFCGKPLVQWTIEQCKECPEIDDVYVSSDSEKILELAKKLRCIPFKRKEKTTDSCTSEDSIKEWLEDENTRYEEIDYIVFPQVTSPVRTVNDLSNAIHTIIDSNSDSLFSAYGTKDLYLWNNKLERLTYKEDLGDGLKTGKYRDYKKENMYVENGSVYVSKTEKCFHMSLYTKRYVRVIDENVIPYIMPRWKSHEIDTNGDWYVCEMLMKKILNGDLK